MVYVIKVGADRYVVATLVDGRWSAPSAHHDGLRTIAPRGATGLEYVLGAALRRSPAELFHDQIESAISVEEAERL